VKKLMGSFDCSVLEAEAREEEERQAATAGTVRGSQATQVNTSSQAT
jgi:hypothetical protein